MTGLSPHVIKYDGDKLVQCIAYSHRLQIYYKSLVGVSKTAGHWVANGLNVSLNLHK